MTRAECAVDCGRPAPSSVICSHCTWLLERELGDVTALAEDLDVALSRQVRIGNGSGGRRSPEVPLAFGYDPAEAGYVLRTALVGWVRELADGPAAGDDWPADTLPGMAAWLLCRAPDLAAHTAAAEAFDEITSAVANARRAVDSPSPRVFAGVCGVVPTQDGAPCGPPCPGSVYGKPGQEFARCELCQHPHDVRERQQDMRADLDDRLFTAAEIAGLGVYLGDTFDRKRTRNLLTKWGERKLLAVRGINSRGEPTYRFGDAMDRLVSSLRRVG